VTSLPSVAVAAAFGLVLTTCAAGKKSTPVKNATILRAFAPSPHSGSLERGTTSSAYGIEPRACREIVVEGNGDDDFDEACFEEVIAEEEEEEEEEASGGRFEVNAPFSALACAWNALQL